MPTRSLRPSTWPHYRHSLAIRTMAVRSSGGPPEEDPVTEPALLPQTIALGAAVVGVAKQQPLLPWVAVAPRAPRVGIDLQRQDIEGDHDHQNHEQLKHDLPPSVCPEQQQSAADVSALPGGLPTPRYIAGEERPMFRTWTAVNANPGVRSRLINAENPSGAAGAAVRAAGKLGRAG